MPLAPSSYLSSRYGTRFWTRLEVPFGPWLVPNGCLLVIYLANETCVCTAYMHFHTANLELYFMPASPYRLYPIGFRSCHGLRINPQPFIVHVVPCLSLLPYLVKET